MNTQITRNIALLNKLKIEDFNCSYNTKYKVCTIYAIYNKITGKIYIGQTILSPTKRWHDHFTNAKNKGKRNYFQLAIMKYGWDNFEKYVIWQYQCKSIHESTSMILNCREIYFIKLFKSSNRSFGYNSTNGGNTGYTYYVGDQNKIVCPIQNGAYKSRACLQFDLNFNLIKEWKSAADAGRELLISDSQIRDCCDRNQHTCNNYVWVWKDLYTSDYFKKHLIKTNIVSSEKAVFQYNFLGEFIKEWHSASQAAIENGWDKSLVSGAANGKTPQCKGFVWIYKKDFTEQLLSQKLNIVKNLSTYNEWLDKTLPSDIANAHKIYKDGYKIKVPRKRVSELTLEQHEELKRRDKIRREQKLQNMSEEELLSFRKKEQERARLNYIKRKNKL